MIGAVLGAVGGAFGNAINNAHQSQEAQKNREWQEYMLDKQNKYNTEMWEKTNEYNSPENQVARLNAAGINPYMALGSVSSGSASNASSSSAPSGTMPQTKNVFEHLPQSGMAISQLLQQKKIVDADVANKDSQTALNEIAAKFNALERITDLRVRLSEEKKNMSSVDYNNSMTALNDMEAMYFSKAKGTEIQANEYRAINERLSNTLLQLQIQGFPERYAAEVAEIFSRVRLNDASAVRTLRTDLEQKFGKMPKNIAQEWAKAELEFQKYIRDYRKNNRGSDTQMQYWQSVHGAGSAAVTALGVGSAATDIFGSVLKMWLSR